MMLMIPHPLDYIFNILHIFKTKNTNHKNHIHFLARHPGSSADFVAKPEVEEGVSLVGSFIFAFIFNSTPV